MVAAATIHFEGHSKLRAGFHSLFGPHVERARQRRMRFNLIAGGSRAETIKDFVRSCRSHPSDVNVLVIDSERPVSDTASAIRSLRAESFWDGGVSCDDDQINLMVRAMEAWIIADPEALRKHFGPNFNVNVLPSPQNAESVAPRDMVAAIGKGLPSSRRRRYDKVADGARLLKLIDAVKVGRHCRHFKRLMDYLDREI